MTRLVDKDHYPWADPTSVPKVPIVPTLFAGLLPQVPEKGMFDVQALGESCLFRTAMSLVGGEAVAALPASQLGLWFVAFSLVVVSRCGPWWCFWCAGRSI